MGIQSQHRAKSGRRFNVLSLSLLIFLGLCMMLMMRSPPEEDKTPPTFTIWGWKSYTPECNYEDYIFGDPISQTDPCLVAIVRDKMMIPPPPQEEVNYDPVNITTEITSNIEKFKWIQKLLVGNNNPPRDQPGFFIECGANDGLFISSTLNIERTLNWTGLLVEANPTDFKTLVGRKRNAWAINAAACITPHPGKVDFFINPGETGISGLNENVRRGVTSKVTVQCIPLYTMLAALNVHTVDFLNLDVEGLELAVLETIPFDKVTFKVMAIEYDHIPGKQKALQDFLEPKGYKFVKEILDPLTLDSLYVHESLYALAKSIDVFS